MSDFDDPRDDVNADRAPSIADSASAAPANPRKRKKSSRACDYCHINHQPCDNAKPRCSYCERHNKSCLYLRPQKKRGPAQGYRSALHTLRESAAAWGVALNLIPSLGPVIEGYLKQDEGRRLTKAIKDPAQQEFFIQAWQQSGVFKTFFPDDEGGSDGGSKAGEGDAAPLELPNQPVDLGQQTHLTPAEFPFPKLETAPACAPTPTSSQDGSKGRETSTGSHFRPRQGSMSLSDIVAKDAARSAQGFSQTLGSLGFAPNETVDDFLDMSYNPEPTEQSADLDPSLGSEIDQKAYYGLIMGKRFV